MVTKLSILIFGFMLIVFILALAYVMYEIWAYKQEEKRKDERKPFSKMEYDCTENYFD